MSSERKSFLTSLGVLGWDQLEVRILSFLLTGGSILLVGPHGVAKTRLAHRLAKLLGATFAKYDASKSMWEDIAGFPDPARLMSLELREENKLPRIETPNTIWGKQFLLIDEINRASPETQSKWLEVILDQTLMGEPTGAKWIISAMNPGYAGTFPLDLALVARYTYFISVPTLESITDDDIRAILSLDNPDETPAIEVEDTEDLTDLSIWVKDVLRKSYDTMPQVIDAMQTSVNNYLVLLARTLLQQANYQTDLRRLRIMSRSIFSSLAVYSVLNDVDFAELTTETVASIVQDVVVSSYPWVTGVESPTFNQLLSAHTAHKALLVNTYNDTANILLQTDPCKMLEALYKKKDRKVLLERTVMNRLLETNEAALVSVAILYKCNQDPGTFHQSILNKACAHIFSLSATNEYLPFPDLSGSMAFLPEATNKLGIFNSDDYLMSIASWIWCITWRTNKDDQRGYVDYNVQEVERIRDRLVRYMEALEIR